MFYIIYSNDKGIVFHSCSEIKWNYGKVITSIQNKPSPRKLPQFVYPSGPSPRTKSVDTPLQVVQLFLTNVILDSIVQQTNVFASQKGVVLNFCLEELKSFLGLNIAMGMLRLPQIRDYWACNHVLATPWFPSIMSRDRFISIIDTYIVT